MKNNLRMLGLALCMLPMYLHAGNRPDLKVAELIPAGTVLPVTLNSTMRSDKSISGAPITATLMQDVSLGDGKTLPAGSRITGHVIATITPGKGSDDSGISFQFEQVRLGNQTVPVTTSLRAIASWIEVSDAQVPTGGGDVDSSSSWTLVQIGGDQVSYGMGGPVMLGSEAVGTYTSQGVLAKTTARVGAECRDRMDSNANPQAFGIFSVNACGTYGLDDAHILRSGNTEGLGEVTLVSHRKSLKIGKGSAMLLQVERNVHDGWQAQAASSAAQ